MKIICSIHTDEVLHTFLDSADIELSESGLVLNYKYKDNEIIEGFDNKNFVIYEGVDVPKKWKSRRFKYSPESGWRPNYEIVKTHKREFYESFHIFFKVCEILYEKQYITEEEYKSLIDFGEYECYIPRDL